MSVIRPATLTTTVYERLRRDLLKAVFWPGEKLRIETLCDRYQAGASPVREALSRLSAEGIVTREDLRGFRVSPVSVHDLNELTETRCAINELALRQAIAKGDAAWEEQVLLANHRLMRTPVYEPGSATASLDWEHRHREFHAALIAACGSRWICDFAAMLFDLAARYRHLSTVGDPARSDDEHPPIAEAVLARDADRAVSLLNEHMRHTREIVTNITEFENAANRA